jgi:hypothetical protein
MGRRMGFFHFAADQIWVQGGLSPGAARDERYRS